MSRRGGERGGGEMGDDRWDYDWQEMDSAPRDGRIILLTWMENGEPAEIWPMRWSRMGTNDFFAPGVIGIWELSDGSLTWNEADPMGAPTHWAPAPFSNAPQLGLRLVWDRDREVID